MSRKLALDIFDELQRQAGPGLEILNDQADSRFQDFAKRWSDIDRQIPAAIVLPESEEHIQQTVNRFNPPLYKSEDSMNSISVGPLGCRILRAVYYHIRWP